LRYYGRERKEKLGGIMRDTTFLGKGAEQFSGFEGSQAVYAHPGRGAFERVKRWEVTKVTV
jgi:hypothetical protein